MQQVYVKAEAVGEKRRKTDRDKTEKQGNHERQKLGEKRKV